MEYFECHMSNFIAEIQQTSQALFLHLSSFTLFIQVFTHVQDRDARNWQPANENSQLTLLAGYCLTDNSTSLTMKYCCPIRALIKICVDMMPFSEGSRTAWSTNQRARRLLIKFTQHWLLYYFSKPLDCLLRKALDPILHLVCFSTPTITSISEIRPP